eukprot:3527663-Pleurochrysis_carterae.AAC.1
MREDVGIFRAEGFWECAFFHCSTRRSVPEAVRNGRAQGDERRRPSDPGVGCERQAHLHPAGQGEAGSPSSSSCSFPTGFADWYLSCAFGVLRRSAVHICWAAASLRV